jgi:two-component system sensor histidine kinase MtrB
MFFRRAFRAVKRILASSLQVRALAIMLVLAGAALIVLGGVLSFSIGNGLYNTRLQQVTSESSRAILVLQGHFIGAKASDRADLARRMSEVVPDLESSGVAQSRLVALIPVGGINQPLGGEWIHSEKFDLRSIDTVIQAQVEAAKGNLISKPFDLTFAGSASPTALIGSLVHLNGAGNYELFLAYDLSTEAGTLDFVQRTLIFGGLITLAIIGSLSYLVITWLVEPVRQAAEFSKRIAASDFKDRMKPKGNDVISVLTNSLNSMADSLEQKIQSLNELSIMQQRFVADVSHELRTPLSTMKLTSEVLYANRENFVEPSKRSAELMFEQVNRFEALLKDLLEISRYDAMFVNPGFEMQDLNGMVGKALVGIQPLADSKGVHLEVKIPNGAVPVEADAVRIERILSNLLTNAVEHGDGKPVTVQVGQNHKAVAVTVTDRGIGMNEEERALAFDRFWRADPSRVRTTGGTGLGLSISLGDAEVHNGKLELESAPGKGTCFRLTLPKRQGVDYVSSPLPLKLDGE